MIEAVEMAIQLGFSTFHGTVALNAVQVKWAYTDTRGSRATSSCLQSLPTLLISGKVLVPCEIFSVSCKSLQKAIYRFSYSDVADKY